MKLLELTGWPALIIAIAMVAAGCAIVYALNASQQFHDWLNTPLRDAKVKDAAVLLIAFAMLRRK